MVLFRDDNDRHKYLDVLQAAKEKYPFELNAFCLMDNHVHLLLKETDTPLSLVMKSIGIRYSIYFNKKYERIGHLFQDRYRSQAITSESQYLACARYIHNNPVKAGLANRPGDFAWSSFQSYCQRGPDSLINKTPLMAYCEDSIIRLLDYTNAANDDKFIDYDSTEETVDPHQVIEDFLNQKFGLKPGDVRDLKKELRDSVLRELKNQTTLTQSELAAMLAISRRTISRA